MARNPDVKIAVTQRDQSGEDTVFSVRPSVPVDMSTLPLGFTDLVSAIDTELVLGEFIQYSQNEPLRLSNVAEGAGNREDKLLLTYEDSTTFKIYQTEIGCRQTGLTTVGVGSDSVPPATWSDTKAKWDAFVVSPDGNATSLLDVEIIGRNV